MLYIYDQIEEELGSLLEVIRKIIYIRVGMRPSEDTRQCDAVRDKLSIALTFYWIEKTLLGFNLPSLASF